MSYDGLEKEIETDYWTILRNNELKQEIEDSIWESLILHVNNFEYFEKELRVMVHKIVHNLIETIGFALFPSYLKFMMSDERELSDEDE